MADFPNMWTSDPFDMVNLSIAIEKLLFDPGRLGQLGLFEEAGIDSLSLTIEDRGDQLVLIPPTPRGGPGTTMDKLKATLRPPLRIPHFEIDDAVMAEEVQGKRRFGTVNERQVLMERIADRGVQARRRFAVTHEYSRLGAVTGLVRYADGTQLDLYNWLGLTKLSDVYFDLTAASPAGGILRRRVNELAESLIDELGALPYTGIRAICGSTFWHDLIQNIEVRQTFLATLDGQELRTAYVDLPGGQAQKIYGTFAFGGISWEAYRGGLGGVKFVPDDLCYFVPEGVPGLFLTRYAPADYNETVNTLGQSIYARMLEMRNGKGYELEFQSNALHICTRPRALITGHRGAAP